MNQRKSDSKATETTGSRRADSRCVARKTKGKGQMGARERREKRRSEITSILERLRTSGGGTLAPTQSEADAVSPKAPDSGRQGSNLPPGSHEQRRASVSPFVQLKTGRQPVADSRAHLDRRERSERKPRSPEKPSENSASQIKPRKKSRTGLTGQIAKGMPATRHRTARERRHSREVMRDGPIQPRMAAARHISRSMPPVMARRRLNGALDWREDGVATASHRWDGAPRRTYYVSLATPGAEVRLPALPRVQWGWRAFSAIMVVMLLLSLFFLWTQPGFRVVALEAEGLQRLTVNDLSTVTGVLGQSIFAIDPVLLESTLSQAFPELAQVKVRLGLPAKVRITVLERQPVVAWVQNGRELWVDIEGATFPPRGEADNLVRVDANAGTVVLSTDAVDLLYPGVGPAVGTTSVGNPRLVIPAELVSTVLLMAEHTPQGSSLLYDAEHGLGWEDTQGWKVYIGTDLDDISIKLLLYEALVERLQAEGIRPELISVEYVHAPYYRMER